jgi:hypothetical protein
LSNSALAAPQTVSENREGDNDLMISLFFSGGGTRAASLS